MDLDSFYEKEFDEYSKDPDNFCNICYSEHDASSIQLRCGHKYHYQCIKDSYKINNTKKPRSCPYCRKDGGYLRVMNDDIPELGIHKEKEFENDYKRCFGIIMSGHYKNTRCTSKCNLLDENGNLTNYCKRHKKQYKNKISFKDLETS